MTFLLLNTDYPEFLQWLYDQHHGLERQPYEQQMRVRNDSLFGVADFYSSNLQRLGHMAYDIHANNPSMQKAWAQEHGLAFGPDWRWQFRLRRGFVPWVSRVRNRLSYEVLAAQIRHYKPEVLLNQAMGEISSRFLREMRSEVRLLVGQHAATPLRQGEDWGVYDLVISSFPPTVEWFRRREIPAELNRMGFETRVTSTVAAPTESFDVTFIGAFHGPIYESRLTWLEVLCKQLSQMAVWGPKADHLSPASPVRQCYKGQAWGEQMLRILRGSKLTLNHHGDIAPYANNMRLYEATGVGALLITDWKENLREMFEPGKEVVAYRTPEECAKMIRYYLEHEEERQTIARAGQERTLQEHTYYHRMQELVDLVLRHV